MACCAQAVMLILSDGSVELHDQDALTVGDVLREHPGCALGMTPEMDHPRLLSSRPLQRGATYYLSPSPCPSLSPSPRPCPGPAREGVSACPALPPAPAAPARQHSSSLDSLTFSDLPMSSSLSSATSAGTSICSNPCTPRGIDPDRARRSLTSTREGPQSCGFARSPLESLPRCSTVTLGHVAVPQGQNWQAAGDLDALQKCSTLDTPGHPQPCMEQAASAEGLQSLQKCLTMGGPAAPHWHLGPEARHPFQEFFRSNFHGTLRRSVPERSDFTVSGCHGGAEEAEVRSDSGSEREEGRAHRRSLSLTRDIPDNVLWSLPPVGPTPPRGPLVANSLPSLEVTEEDLMGFGSGPLGAMGMPCTGGFQPNLQHDQHWGPPSVSCPMGLQWRAPALPRHPGSTPGASTPGGSTQGPSPMFSQEFLRSRTVAGTVGMGPKRQLDIMEEEDGTVAMLHMGMDGVFRCKTLGHATEQEGMNVGEALLGEVRSSRARDDRARPSQAGARVPQASAWGNPKGAKGAFLPVGVIASSMPVLSAVSSDFLEGQVIGGAQVQPRRRQKGEGRGSSVAQSGLRSGKLSASLPRMARGAGHAPEQKPQTHKHGFFRRSKIIPRIQSLWRVPSGNASCFVPTCERG